MSRSLLLSWENNNENVIFKLHLVFTNFLCLFNRALRPSARARSLASWTLTATASSPSKSLSEDVSRIQNLFGCSTQVESSRTRRTRPQKRGTNSTLHFILSQILTLKIDSCWFKTSREKEFFVRFASGDRWKLRFRIRQEMGAICFNIFGPFRVLENRQRWVLQILGNGGKTRPFS